MANRNFASQKLFSGHVMPVHIDLRATVDATDTDGLGITSLKGPYVQNVFMHTSATPGVGNSNPRTPGIEVTNPNPASGIIVVQLEDNYQSLYLASASIVAPTSGSALKIDNSALTAGMAYTITTLGDATAAKWRAIGVPSGITPAVGVTFIAASDGGSGNTLTSRVMAAAASGVYTVELMPNSQSDLAPAPSSTQGFGAQIILLCRDAAGALVAPADGSVIQLSFLLSNSSITVQGD